MFTKALSLLLALGVLALSGCHDECCNRGDGNRNEYDNGRTTYAPDNNDTRAVTAEGTTTNYYDNSANEYAEGTVSTVAPDGSITLRGYESPYANSYSSYHREYYAMPVSQREARAREIREKYQGKLNYSEYKDKERDYNFHVSTPERFTGYDESSRYGRSADTWSYSTPRTYRYNDIKAGDRVVVGYDSNNPSAVRSMYRVELNKK